MEESPNKPAISGAYRISVRRERRTLNQGVDPKKNEQHWGGGKFTELQINRENNLKGGDYTKKKKTKLSRGKREGNPVLCG